MVSTCISVFMYAGGAFLPPASSKWRKNVPHAGAVDIKWHMCDNISVSIDPLRR